MHIKPTNMTRKKYDGKAEGGKESQVSRFGRAVKKPKQFETVIIRGKEPRYGKWKLAEKRKLFECLKRHECVYTNANFVYKSVGTKQRHLVDEYLKRLRRRAADKCDKMRRKQPPILTWFQVADEVTWMKADEDLFEAMGTMLSIYSVEANNMQERNKTLRFGNLYKYIIALQKDEKLPELTPAESVVLLDCFQHLADTLRICDTEDQGKFMQSQYQKFFSLLYVNPGPKTTGKRRNNSKSKVGAKDTGGKTKTSSQSMRPLMKAQLVKKTDKKKLKKKGSKNENSFAEEQGQSSSSLQQNEGDNQRSPKQLIESENQTPVVENETGSKELRVDNDITSVEEETVNNERLHSIGQDCQAEKGSAEALDESNVTEDLDPDSPNFLEMFANKFSLGSLNPFEIPTELLYLRKKERNRGELPKENLSSVQEGDALSTDESDGSFEDEDEDYSDEDYSEEEQDFIEVIPAAEDT